MQPEPATSLQKKTQLVNGKYGMIVTANPYASEAGLRILKSGGTAIDAAIAAQMVLTLVEPQSSGIGGGGFLLLYDPKTHKTLAFDGRETAPKSAQPSLLLEKNGQAMPFFKAIVGGRTVGVPGLLKMFAQAQKKHGHLPWAALFNDAISLAKKGFILSKRLHTLLDQDPYLLQDPVAKHYFYDENNHAWPIGKRLINLALAKSLESIQQQGVHVFYKGYLAQDIVAKVQNHPKNPGQLTMQDMANYQAKIRQPICVHYRNLFRACSMPPPSSGGITIAQILKIIEYSFKPQRFFPHYFAEANKLAFADRNTYLADPDFVQVPIKSLLDNNYLQSRAKKINHNSALQTPVAAGYHPNFSPDSSEKGQSTTHISVIDRSGMIVSLTSSIENVFGSRQMVDGFLLNNQLSDFSFLPEKNGKPIANRVQGGKRPLSSMSPTIVFAQKSHRPLLILGSPGGSQIIAYVAQTILSVLEQGDPLNVALRRGHLSNLNGPTFLEKDTKIASLKSKLEALKHQVHLIAMTSGLHVIQVLKNGQILAAADPRREGIALGF
jgi:gamma-glutamyltranspeptidase / glutathione hydrolase